MKAQIKQTKRNTYIQIGEVVYQKNNDWSTRNFVKKENNEDLNFTTNCVEIEGDDLNDVYQKYIDYLKSERDERANNNTRQAEKMQEIINNQANYSASEILEAVYWAARQGWGWRATDILLAGNALSKLLLKKIGSYTVSAFDDNSIMVKAGNKRYGALRKWQSLTDLINE